MSNAILMNNFPTVCYHVLSFHSISSLQMRSIWPWSLEPSYFPYILKFFVLFGENIYGCSRPGCKGEYLNLGEGKWRYIDKNYIKETSYLVLFAKYCYGDTINTDECTQFFARTNCTTLILFMYFSYLIFIFIFTL